MVSNFNSLFLGHHRQVARGPALRALRDQVPKNLPGGSSCPARTGVTDRSRGRSSPRGALGEDVIPSEGVKGHAAYHL